VPVRRPPVGHRAERQRGQRSGRAGRALLELVVEDFGDQLEEAGYLQLVDDDSDALYVALDDAVEAQRAREVIAAHGHLFDDEDDVALALRQAAVVMDEQERVHASWRSTAGSTGPGRCRR
jgi:hypothetical protein